MYSAFNVNKFFLVFVGNTLCVCCVKLKDIKIIDNKISELVYI